MTEAQIHTQALRDDKERRRERRLVQKVTKDYRALMLQAQDEVRALKARLHAEGEKASAAQRDRDIAIEQREGIRRELDKARGDLDDAIRNMKSKDYEIGRLNTLILKMSRCIFLKENP